MKAWVGGADRADPVEAFVLGAVIYENRLKGRVAAIQRRREAFRERPEIAGLVEYGDDDGYIWTRDLHSARLTRFSLFGIGEKGAGCARLRFAGAGAA